MAKLFTLEVLTPNRQFFSENVEAVVAVISDGEIGVYADHSPFTAALLTSVLKIKNANGEWRVAAVTDGNISVTSAGALILATTAEWADEIDVARAEAAKQRALDRLAVQTLKFETARSQAALARAQNRIRASTQYSHYKKM